MFFPNHVAGTSGFTVFVTDRTRWATVHVPPCHLVQQCSCIALPSCMENHDPMGSASRMATARGTHSPAAWERPAGSLPTLHSSLLRSQDTGALQRGCPRDPTSHPKG